MRRWFLILLPCLVTAFATASAQGDVRAPDEIVTLGPLWSESDQRLLIQGSTDVEPFTPVLQAFSARFPNLAIRYEEILTNELYERAMRACRDGAAVADLVISSAIDLQVKLVNDSCAQPHVSDHTEPLPDWANWRDEMFGITFEPAVIVYNRDRVPPEQVPRSRFDLIDMVRPAENPYSGRIATYDIEQSGLGYLFAFVDSQHATTFGRLIEAFARNRMVATCCSAEIIDGVAEGRYLLAYNMLGSYALARAEIDPRIGVVAPADYTLILARAALVPRWAENPEPAKRFIDFLLSEEGRRQLAEASLIVSFGSSDDGGSSLLSGGPSTLHPIPFSPALLVGLDLQKREIFLDLWRSSVGHIRE
ncbi:MAG: ABC transporter substrate-binding protein [Kiloniellaceae bacterium]